MPSQIQLPFIDTVNLDSEPLPQKRDEIADRYALALVKRTFDAYERFRSNNHDTRWNVHDELYYGWVAPKVWAGTNVPRSAIAKSIVFKQVESLVPAIYQNIFNVGPEWFDIAAEEGVDPREARQIQDVLSYYLEHPGDDSGVSAKAELALAMKSMALYGNGGVSIEWNSKTDRPDVKHIDLRNIYFDPTAQSASTDACEAVIVRKMLSVEELLDMAQDERMNIPSADALYTLAQQTPITRGDQTLRTAEATRKINYLPNNLSYTPNPAAQKVEVLVYYSKTRIVWVLGRQHVAYNVINPYKFIPFVFAPCYTVLGRFYAQSIADIQEGNQRYVQALLNARLDELALQLHPPRIVPRGSQMTPASLSWKPGGVYTYENPKDVQVIAPAGATTNVFPEISYFETTSDEMSGLSGLSGGIPRPSNANRTMGGMQIQLQGSGNRISDLVANFENYLLLPLLYKMYEMIRFHKNQGESIPAYNEEKGLYRVKSETLNRKCRFRMSAASRMVTRDRLIQIFPFLAQFLLSGPLLEQLSKTGKTVDFEEILQMLQDATNVGRRYRLVRNMNPQEMQAAQQPPPQVAAAMQKTQMDNQTKLQVATINNQPNPAEMEAQKLAAQMDMAKMQQTMQLEREKAQLEMQVKAILAKIQVESKREEARAKAEDHAAQMQLKQREGAMQLQRSVLTHQLNLQQTVEQAEAKRRAAEIAPQTPAGLGQSKRNPQLASRPVSRITKRKKPANE